MLRGNERKEIFLDDEDRLKFLDLLYTKTEDEGCQLYAYCLMDNHVHMVIKEGSNGIAKIMKRIAISYVSYFNRKYKRVGHLFQDRYKSENIETESYLLTVIRYVHQNPEKAGIAKAEEYHWSSYPVYLSGQENRRHLPEMVEILQIFAEVPDIALARFRQFHREFNCEVCININDGKELDEDKRTEIRQYFEKLLENQGLDLSDLTKAGNPQVRKELVLKLKQNTGLSGRKLAELTGISRETIRKILLSE